MANTVNIAEDTVSSRAGVGLLLGLISIVVGLLIVRSQIDNLNPSLALYIGWLLSLLGGLFSAAGAIGWVLAPGLDRRR